ncbi:ORF 41 [Haloarcula hispanica virus SH1]|uniref:ORF 41 n=1 Tax=Haloarcula hispanica SH1 virus TaxID=326574 RepID=Q4KPE6_9VIRU|nr:ORF 41 [Haloarcula hispanica virus SH1]AAY24967.1 ORF 41 [Haloarcula hispanica virus SH1]
MNPEHVERPDERFASRITVDLDGDKYTHTQFDLEAVKVWHNLQNSADYVDVHVSSSGLGLHFVAWFEQPLRFHEEVAIRRSSGDDPRRVWMDCQRWLNGLYTDVLFEEKDTREFDKERDFATVYDALAFVAEHRTDDADRMKRLANEGHRAAPDLARKARREA